MLMPSKKIILLLLACVTGVGLVFFAIKSSAPTTYKNLDAQNVQAILINKALTDKDDLDSDNDGLNDWEEALWKTDPQNPDTDGDQISDNEEAETGRDPLVAGEGTNKINSLQTTEPKNLTETEKLSRAFFEYYLLSKQKGITKEESSKFLGEVLLSKVYLPINFKYQNSDLNIIKKEDINTLRNYGNNLGKIIKNSKLIGTIEDLIVFQKAIQSENYVLLDKFNETSQNYVKFAEEILKIPVPEKISNSHLLLINSSINLAQNLKEMKEVKNNAVLALSGFSSHQKNSDNLNFAFSTIQTFLFNNNVVFQQSDDGSFLFPTI